MREFEVASGARLTPDEVPAGDDAPTDTPAGEQAPDFGRPTGCGSPTMVAAEEWDEESEVWVVLLVCTTEAWLVGVDPTGVQRWQTLLPVPVPPNELDSDGIALVDVGYQLAAVQAESENDLVRQYEVIGVDTTSGELLPPTPALRQIAPAGAAAVPGGLCTWGGARDVEVACADAATGQVRWSRDDPVRSFKAPAAVVLADRVLMLITDDTPSRWVGYRLGDGEPVFDLDRFAPNEPSIEYYGRGVLVLGAHEYWGLRTVVVYGEAP